MESANSMVGRVNFAIDSVKFKNDLSMSFINNIDNNYRCYRTNSSF